MRSLTLEPIRLPEGEPPGPCLVYDRLGMLLRVMMPRVQADAKTRKVCRRHGRVGCHAFQCIEREQRATR